MQRMRNMKNMRENDVNICVGNFCGWTIWKRGLLTPKCKQTSDEEGEGASHLWHLDYDNRWHCSILVLSLVNII